METHLADWLKGTPDGEEAEAILRKCVHCGFCTATCPTYQLLGDELDGPRGRIYLIKQVVEGKPATAATMSHLDRCLTCRNCESTCPSGVQYGHLVDVGRKLVERQVKRPLGERIVRTALREGLTRRWLFDPAMRVGQAVRPLLPATLRDKVPARRPAGAWPTARHERRVLILNGCTQPAMMPSIDAATARVLDRLGVQVVVEPRSGCCGAIRQHLNDPDGALADARRNIAAWWPHVEAGAEAIVINASGCGAMVKDYAHLLRDDPEWGPKALRIVSLTRDLAEWLPAVIADAAPALREKLAARGAPKVAFHPPCTLQHGQQVRGAVEKLLASLGVQSLPVADSHLCCGSAGTYSVLQPALSKQLRERKLANLQAGQPDLILSANIGCLAHLQAGTGTPVRHWIEWLDEAMAAPG
ncbi:glycolate oxidase subunit GlcF [Burkholderiaceae bacterium FT117]|uniref:glycolate oxidase subunit GlcF n=1 Tax=Zeimonas sediminis TaxID=2944268 RepID=UPI0023430E73|nr:glycolate oxidase subunit GlcF [Zeimonas sediminis]MCM5570628.1 glycolate oxidase subunit GlcF [Zeimonas sediminis]